MNYLQKFVLLVTTVLFGIAHAELIPIPWSYISVHSPVVNYAFANLVESELFWPTILLHDFLINIVVHLPGAVVVALFLCLKFRFAPFVFVFVNFTGPIVMYLMIQVFLCLCILQLSFQS